MAQSGRLDALVQEYERVERALRQRNGIGLSDVPAGGTPMPVPTSRMLMLARVVLGMPLINVINGYPTPTELARAKTRKLRAVHPDRLSGADFDALDRREGAQLGCEAWVHLARAR